MQVEGQDEVRHQSPLDTLITKIREGVEESNSQDLNNDKKDVRGLPDEYWKKKGTRVGLNRFRTAKLVKRPATAKLGPPRPIHSTIKNKCDGEMQPRSRPDWEDRILKEEKEYTVEELKQNQMKGGMDNEQIEEISLIDESRIGNGTLSIGNESRRAPQTEKVAD